MPSVVDDIADIILIATIFSLPAVLRYLLSRVIVGQTPVATGQWCCFTSGSFSLIMWSVATRGLKSLVFGSWGRCNDVACCLNPLLGQGDE
jgi:hypothetical protein